jgi:excisionase family DNA binding protein
MPELTPHSACFKFLLRFGKLSEGLNSRTLIEEQNDRRYNLRRSFNMAEEKLLTIRDVSLILGISEKEVIELAERGEIPAYKVGGVYLRFKRQQVEDFRRKSKLHLPPQKVSAEKSSLRERLDDFFYFNDFYILAFLLILLIVVMIFKGY